MINQVHGDQFVRVLEMNSDSTKARDYIVMAAKAIMISRQRDAMILAASDPRSSSALHLSLMQHCLHSCNKKQKALRRQCKNCMVQLCNLTQVCFG